MRVANKVALITGAASGMGAATARLLAREGAKVVVADMMEAEGRAVVAEITKAGGSASYINLDVADEAQWEAAIAAVMAAHGRLDVLVNNAGISGSNTNNLYDTALWDRIMAVNARGVFLGVKHGVAAMRQSGGGSIINLSSISGVVGQDRIHCAYNASKAAVRLLTKNAAVRWGPPGVRVNSVHPGYLPPMLGGTNGPGRSAKIPLTPLRRLGEAIEVAYGVLFLASDEASFITGTELVIDGGFIAQ
jgi:NAD(P)-dependent dehydrogenase (short-subunit alcohol dehydrogenase family)